MLLLSYLRYFIFSDIKSSLFSVMYLSDILCSGSDVRGQVYVDGPQHRHDGQVEEGEACQLDPKGEAGLGRGHGQQHAHRPINPAPSPIQDLPH